MDRQRLNRLRFHLARLIADPDPRRAEDWEMVARCAAELAEGASWPARDALLRLSECARARRLPHDALVIAREVELACSHDPARPVPPAEPPEERVARLLSDRSLVVVGGDTGREHGERWRQAFGLREVHWRTTSKANPSVASIEPLIARPEVAAVLVLIRWVRHATHDGIAQACERHGKPLVRVRAGYHPTQLAIEILRQCGSRLERPGR